MALIPRRKQPVNQDFLDQAASPGDDRLVKYALFGDYYTGRDQGTQLTDRTKKYLQRQGSVLKWRENFCEPLVDVYAERLQVTGFASNLPAQGDDPPALDEWLDLVWQRNRMDAKQAVVHTAAIYKGDKFVLVDYDYLTGLPRVTCQRPETIKPHYGDEYEDLMEWASKTWTTQTVHPRLNAKGRAVQRLNLYWPDRVEKWFRVTRDSQGGWEPWADLTDEGEEPWPVPWVRSDGSPRGVPIFHFKHKSLGADFGRSELENVIPEQDELNKQIIDLNMVLDNHAAPQRWAVGVPADNTSLKSAIGNVWHAASEDAKFGQLEPFDPRGVLDAIEGTISRMARRSRTPLHLLTGGDMPSGEALRTAEAGLVAKVLACQTPFGNVWEDVMRMCILLAEDEGSAPPGVTITDDLVLETQWDDPLSRNEKEEAETAGLWHDLGVSKHTLLLKAGFDPDEEAERRGQEADVAQENLGVLMDRGGPPFNDPMAREAA